MSFLSFTVIFPLAKNLQQFNFSLISKKISYIFKSKFIIVEGRCPLVVILKETFSQVN